MPSRGAAERETNQVTVTESQAVDNFPSNRKKEEAWEQGVGVRMEGYSNQGYNDQPGDSDGSKEAIRINNTDQD